MRRELGENGETGPSASVLLQCNIGVTLEELLKYRAKRLHPNALPDSISIEEEESHALE